MEKSEEEKVRDRIANTKYYLKNKDKVRKQQKEYHKDYYQKVKDKKKQYHIDNFKRIQKYKKQYFIDNKEKFNQLYIMGINSHSGEYKRDWYNRNRNKILNSLRFKAYQITEEEYYNILEKQNYKCAICGKDQLEFKTSLCVDHDHNTGKIRGLLCKNCNLILGNAKDDISTLINAAKYLENNGN
jgi:hypothetical protein